MSMNPIPGPIGFDRPTKSDRNPGYRITNGSDGKIIITHLITIHLISTMGCNFTQLSDPIGSDCRIRWDSNTVDPLVIPRSGSYEFRRIRRNSHRFLIGSDKIRLSDLITWEPTYSYIGLITKSTIFSYSLTPIFYFRL